MVTFNHASDNPRDLAIRAALRDLAVIASILEPPDTPAVARRVMSSASNDYRADYLRVLGEYVEEFGGRLEEIEGQPVVVFGERRIVILLSRYA